MLGPSATAADLADAVGGTCAARTGTVAIAQQAKGGRFLCAMES